MENATSSPLPRPTSMDITLDDPDLAPYFSTGGTTVIDLDLAGYRLNDFPPHYTAGAVLAHIGGLKPAKVIELLNLLGGWEGLKAFVVRAAPYIRGDLKTTYKLDEFEKACSYPPSVLYQAIRDDVRASFYLTPWNIIGSLLQNPLTKITGYSEENGSGYLQLTVSGLRQSIPWTSTQAVYEAVRTALDKTRLSATKVEFYMPRWDEDKFQLAVAFAARYAVIVTDTEVKIQSRRLSLNFDAPLIIKQADKALSTICDDLATKGNWAQVFETGTPEITVIWIVLDTYELSAPHRKLLAYIRSKVDVRFVSKFKDQAEMKRIISEVAEGSDYTVEAIKRGFDTVNSYVSPDVKSYTHDYVSPFWTPHMVDEKYSLIEVSMLLSTMVQHAKAAALTPRIAILGQSVSFIAQAFNRMALEDPYLIDPTTKEPYIKHIYENSIGEAPPCTLRMQRKGEEPWDIPQLFARYNIIIILNGAGLKPRGSKLNTVSMVTSEVPPNWPGVLILQHNFSKSNIFFNIFDRITEKKKLGVEFSAHMRGSNDVFHWIIGKFKGSTKIQAAIWKAEHGTDLIENLSRYQYAVCTGVEPPRAPLPTDIAKNMTRVLMIKEDKKTLSRLATMSTVDTDGEVIKKLSLTEIELELNRQRTPYRDVAIANRPSDLRAIAPELSGDSNTRSQNYEYALAQMETQRKLVASQTPKSPPPKRTKQLPMELYDKYFLVTVYAEKAVVSATQVVPGNFVHIDNQSTYQRMIAYMKKKTGEYAIVYWHASSLVALCEILMGPRSSITASEFMIDFVHYSSGSVTIQLADHVMTDSATPMTT